MKKIDKLLLTSSFGPFIVSFGIALFVLVMQFLWLYIDEIAGKGVNIFTMVELISYLSLATFPMALPIAVLLASVMVMGNLAERYELSSMKSAGVSLLRVIRTLIVAAAGIAFFSYVCSDFLIPMANLKFKSRLYDIRKQKPALTIEQGIFNEDFRQFVIRVGAKEKDGETIRNVMIEDQSRGGTVRFNQILADSGQMFTTSDDRYFVMNLFNGVQYQEPGTQGGPQKQNYPFVRTKFKSWTKVWDMKEFEMNPTDEGRFANQRSMLSMEQLRVMIDSLHRSMNSGSKQMVDDLLISLNREPVKPVEKAIETPKSPQTARPAAATPPPTQPAKPAEKPKSSRIEPEIPIKPAPQPGTTSKAGQPAKPVTAAPPQKPAESPKVKALTILQREREQRLGVQTPPKTAVYVQKLDKPLNQYKTFLETFEEKDRETIKKDATSRSRSGLASVITRKAQIESRRREAVKTGYELYIKYSYALVCLVFLFIGAPMGAIIRKGGFGYPILVSIIFFVIFVMSSIVCKRLAELYILSPFLSAMVPLIILLPVAVLLTVRAMNDSQMINPDRFINVWIWIKKLVGRSGQPA